MEKNFSRKESQGIKSWQGWLSVPVLVIARPIIAYRREHEALGSLVVGSSDRLIVGKCGGVSVSIG